MSARLATDTISNTITIAPDVTYCEETHTYRHKGVVIPSVNQVLQLAGIEYEPTWNRDLYYLRGQEGTLIHKACDLLDAGKLRWESVHAALRPRVEAYQIAKEKFKVVMLASEQFLVSIGYGFAGRLDRIVRVPHPKLKFDVEAIADIKSAKEVSKGTALQLAGYALAHKPTLWRVTIHLRLDDEGRPNPRLIWYDDPDDLPAFLGCVQAARWKLSHKYNLPSGWIEGGEG